MAAAASAADGIKDAPLKDTTSGRTISLGDRIGVRLTTHQMVEGCIFELHEQEKWMILTQEGANSPLTRTFRILPFSSIDTVQLLESQALVTPVESLPKVDTAKMRRKESQALERARQQLEATNPNASEEGQQLFMALMRTMACKWVNGGDILVLEEVLISPPYTSESCALQSHSGSTSTLERVRKVLGGERAKLGLGASS